MATDYSSFRNLRVERRGAALWVALDNPPLNGLTQGTHTELATIFRVIAVDPDVRAVVLTATGDRAFSAGGDIAAIAAGLDDHVRWAVAIGEAREIVLSLLDCDKPVICRINGHAIGFGASLALCCDVTVIVETARIGDTHVKIGLVAGDGGSVIWPHLVGLMRARRYLLTGELLSGREAAEIGLVTQAVPAAELDATINNWLKYFVEAPTVAVSLTKRALNAGLKHQAQALMDTHLGYETTSRLSADHREAVTAFMEGRAPLFTGR